MVPAQLNRLGGGSATQDPKSKELLAGTSYAELMLLGFCSPRWNRIPTFCLQILGYGSGSRDLRSEALIVPAQRNLSSSWSAAQDPRSKELLAVAFYAALGFGRLAGTAVLRFVCCACVTDLVLGVCARRHPWSLRSATLPDPGVRNASPAIERIIALGGRTFCLF